MLFVVSSMMNKQEMDDHTFRTSPNPSSSAGPPMVGPWSSRSSLVSDPYQTQNSAYDGTFYPASSLTYPHASGFNPASGILGGNPPRAISQQPESMYPTVTSPDSHHHHHHNNNMPMLPHFGGSQRQMPPPPPPNRPSGLGSIGTAMGAGFGIGIGIGTAPGPGLDGSGPAGTNSPGRLFPTAFAGPWDPADRYSPTDSVDDIIASPNLSDYGFDGLNPTSPNGKHKPNGHKGRSQRRPSNRDEFDGPHQFLQRPPPEYIAMQERDLPHLPTNLHVQEQDHVLNLVNERLSQCAYDFVAKYQFPIPLTQDMRPVERPQDREWTEWVYLLKRLATKRRIPARVLYNGQIKQFVTILENSLEMRHAAKHQSRPLKDDRNILQLISAGIQVAKILKDASAMDYLDKLYISTEKQIQDRAASRTLGRK